MIFSESPSYSESNKRYFAKKQPFRKKQIHWTTTSHEITILLFTGLIIWYLSSKHLPFSPRKNFLQINLVTARNIRCRARIWLKYFGSIKVLPTPINLFNFLAIKRRFYGCCNRWRALWLRTVPMSFILFFSLVSGKTFWQ